MFNNCLFWAIWKRATKGGKIIAEPSKYGWWNHYLWVSKDGKLFEFVPVAPKLNLKTLPLLLRVFPVHILLFRGKVKQR